MTEEQRKAWNAAIASGDQALIDSMRDELLTGIHTKIMDEDANYSRAGWKS
jgi:hypothetical protein